MYTVFWDRKSVILLDSLESGKPSTLTATSRRSLSWRLEFPESGQRRRHPSTCKRITPDPIPDCSSWSTLPILAGLSYHTHSVIRFWHLLSSICPTRWKTDYVGNIFVATTPSYELWTVGHLRWCRFSRARTASFCSSLAKLQSQWWWLCRTIVFCSLAFTISNIFILLFLSIVIFMEIYRRHYFRSDPRIYFFRIRI